MSPQFKYFLNMFDHCCSNSFMIEEIWGVFSAHKIVSLDLHGISYAVVAATTDNVVISHYTMVEFVWPVQP